MKALTLSLLLLPAALCAQDAKAPAILVGVMGNGQRAAVQAEFFGPDAAGYFQFFFGLDYAQHELRGMEIPGAPATWLSAGTFPLRTYHAGLMYSHIIRSTFTAGLGVQYREWRDHTEYTLPTMPATHVTTTNWYRHGFDVAVAGGYIIGGWGHITLTYTTRGEVLAGIAVAVRR